MGDPYERLEEDQELRGRLFDVLTQFPVLYQARQGAGTKITNPFLSLGKIIKEHVNPLSLFLNDIVEQVKQGMTYMEALDRVARFALRNKYRNRIIESVKELKSIEEKKPYFLNALARFINADPEDLRAERLRNLHKSLHVWNKKYSSRYGQGSSADLIPWKMTFREQLDGFTDGTYEYPEAHQLEIFRKAVLALEEIAVSQDLFKWHRKRGLKEIQKEILSIAHLLYDYGYTVSDISGRFREDRPFLTRLLNNELLKWLENNVKKIRTPTEVSEHIFRLILLDYQSMIPFRNLYCRLSDRQKVAANAREIERRQQIRPCDFRRVAKLYRAYKQSGQLLLAYFLNYKFSKAFADYATSKDMSGLGKDLTDRFVLRYFNALAAKEKAQQQICSYSSKELEEMRELLALIMDSLSRPVSFKGKRVHILGTIRSGAMGKVLIGIYRGNIVALKEPKYRRNTSEPDYKMLRLLRYEGKVHSHIQADGARYENIVECFGLVQEDEKEMLAIGYHPAETLLEFIRQNRRLSLSISRGAQPLLDLAALKVVSLQLVKALKVLYEKEVVHRDIKPSNILYLVDLEGKISLIKLIDFGVAKAMGSEFGTDPFENQLVGTLSYMAPEQVLKRSFYPSDVYSVGVILYQLLSGKLPLQIQRLHTVAEIRQELKRVIKEQRIPLLDANPMLARSEYLKEFCWIVEKCLALDPEKRIDVLSLEKEIHAFWNSVSSGALEQKILYAA